MDNRYYLYNYIMAAWLFRLFQFMCYIAKVILYSKLEIFVVVNHLRVSLISFTYGFLFYLYGIWKN